MNPSERVERLPQLLRADQVAAALGCPRSTVYWLRAAGRLKGIKIGRMIRFRTEDVRAFIEKGVSE